MLLIREQHNQSRTRKRWTAKKTSSEKIGNFVSYHFNFYFQHFHRCREFSRLFSTLLLIRSLFSFRLFCSMFFISFVFNVFRIRSWSFFLPSKCMFISLEALSFIILYVYIPIYIHLSHSIQKFKWLDCSFYQINDDYRKSTDSRYFPNACYIFIVNGKGRVCIHFAKEERVFVFWNPEFDPELRLVLHTTVWYLHGYVLEQRSSKCMRVRNFWATDTLNCATDFHSSKSDIAP